MMQQDELIKLVKAYDPRADEDALRRACDFSIKAHGKQLRASGEPYVSHPFEVAGILAGMKLDSASIITALLHDTVEDTLATLAEIKEQFGDEVAKLVDGVTKLSRLELQGDQTKQAENFRKLFIAMSEDIRVLLIKLADRLHNMRTLEFVEDPERRKRIALETMEIYAPLAERMGIHRMKDELEDLAFQYTNQEAREGIVARLSFLRTGSSEIIPRIIDELSKLFKENGLKASVTGREKTPYSIWTKMKRKNVTFEQLTDIMAFRAIVENVEQCYQALGIVHAKYHVIPGRFKDYISTPKPNGYRSIHTAIIGPENYRIEIQIRTPEMHEIAELGVAAHWAYKRSETATDGHQYRWLKEILDVLQHAQKPEEFLEHTKLELFQDQVFCFTPRGEIIALPRGACPVDFAYAVHSSIGDTCVGAKVNGRIVPLRTALQNGDQVEIITSKNQTPSPTWERFVVTGRAKSKIRRFARQQQLEQFAEVGWAMLHKIIKQEGVEFSEKMLESLLEQYKAKELKDIYATIGSGELSAREVFYKLYPEHKVIQPSAAVPQAPPKEGEKAKGFEPLPVKGLIRGMAVYYARCCHPLPGDKIVGIITTGKGVTVHTKGCATLANFADTPERWIDVSWEDKGRVDMQSYPARLSITIANTPGAIGNISNTISKANGNVTSLRVANREKEFFDVFLDVEVKSTEHLNDLMAVLRSASGVNSVSRVTGR